MNATTREKTTDKKRPAFHFSDPIPATVPFAEAYKFALANDDRLLIEGTVQVAASRVQVTDLRTYRKSFVTITEKDCVLLPEEHWKAALMRYLVRHAKTICWDTEETINQSTMVKET